jgi:hypothetical protein
MPTKLFIGIPASMVHVHCPRVCVGAGVCVCINSGMLDCLASDQCGTGMKKLMMRKPDPVQEQADAVWHFLVRNQTEIMNPGMPMPELVSLMLMPSYG